MNTQDFLNEAKRYMFFYEKDKEKYEERYSKIESMILQEFQNLNAQYDGLKISFIRGVKMNDLAEGMYNYPTRTCIFFPMHFDIMWEIAKDKIKELYPECSSFRNYIRSQVRHEYRHFQQFEFVRSKGIDPYKFGEFFNDGDITALYKVNPVEVDARNFGVGKATDSDLYVLVDEYLTATKNK